MHDVGHLLGYWRRKTEARFRAWDLAIVAVGGRARENTVPVPSPDGTGLSSHHPVDMSRLFPFSFLDMKPRCAHL